MLLTWSSRDPSATFLLLFNSFLCDLDFFMLFFVFFSFFFSLGVISPHISLMFVPQSATPSPLTFYEERKNIMEPLRCLP